MIEILTMAEEDKLEYFLKGLKYDIQERVALQMPKTLAEACNMAQVINNIRFQIRIQDSNRRNRTTTNQTSQVEVDTIQKGKLTDQEHDNLRRIGACFFCREVGHLS